MMPRFIDHPRCSGETSDVFSSVSQLPGSALVVGSWAVYGLRGTPHPAALVDVRLLDIDISCIDNDVAARTTASYIGEEELST